MSAFTIDNVKVKSNMTKHMKDYEKTSQGVTFRAVLLGLMLIPANICFIMANALTHGRAHPTSLSLFYNVVVTLTVLVGLPITASIYTATFHGF